MIDGEVESPFPEMRLFVGGCVVRGVGSRFRRQAHAHNTKKSEYFGWVCVLSPKRLYTASGKPSTVLYHELAHILTPNQGHTAKWAECLTKLGHPAEAKRSRLRYGQKD